MDYGVEVSDIYVRVRWQEPFYYDLSIVSRVEKWMCCVAIVSKYQNLGVFMLSVVLITVKNQTYLLKLKKHF